MPNQQQQVASLEVPHHTRQPFKNDKAVQICLTPYQETLAALNSFLLVLFFVGKMSLNCNFTSQRSSTNKREKFTSFTLLINCIMTLLPFTLNSYSTELQIPSTLRSFLSPLLDPSKMQRVLKYLREGKGRGR